MATNLTDSNNCIQSGLRADIMRCSMEGKNLLQSANSLYVGAGELVSKGNTHIPKTEELRVESGDFFYSDGVQLKNGNKLSDTNFSASINYSNLKYTWDQYKIQDCNFDSDRIYEGLELCNSNFSSGINYSINFFKNGESVASVGNAGKLRLTTWSDSMDMYLFFSPTGGTLYQGKVSITVPNQPTFYYSFYSSSARQINNLQSFAETALFLYSSNSLGKTYFPIFPTGVVPGTYSEVISSYVMNSIFMVTYSPAQGYYLSRSGMNGDGKWSDDKLAISCKAADYRRIL